MMLRIPRVLLMGLLLSFLPPSTVAWAQDHDKNSNEYLVRIWGANNGLPLTTVTDVAQTPEGYLWVGTLLNGLLRFDGVRFVDFSPLNVPNFGRSFGVRRLLVEKAGRLWVNTFDNLLLTWDKSGFQSARTNAEGEWPVKILWSAPEQVMFVLNDGRLCLGRKNGPLWDWQVSKVNRADFRTQFVADADRRVWYLLDNKELGLWTSGEGKTFVPTELAGQQVNSLAADRQGNIWVGTDKELAKCVAGTFQNMNPAGGEKWLNVKSILPNDNDGSLWVDANGRMRRWLGRQWIAESTPSEPEISQASFSDPTSDHKGGMWFVGKGKNLGLLHLQPDGKLNLLTTSHGLPSNAIQKRLCDDAGNVWAVYGRAGLVQVHPKMFTSIGEPQGLKDALTTSVAEDSQGAVWIGTYGGLVARYLDGQCTNIVSSNIRRVNSVATGADGRIWVGTQNSGLWLCKAGQFQLAIDERQLSGIRLLLPTRDGRLWIGTLNEVYLLSEAKLTRLYQVPNSNFRLASLAESSDGSIYAGTTGGLLQRWRGTNFETIPLPLNAQAAFGPGRLWALCPSAEGGLWAGYSRGGLLHWRNGQVRSYTVKDGLPTDSIVQILTDDSGALWLGTGVGIVRVDHSSLALFDRGEIQTLPYSLYGLSEGLLTIGSAIEYQPNCCRGHDGTLWFAMENSVVGVRPNRVRVNFDPPTVVIEEVFGNERSVWPVRPAQILCATAILPNKTEETKTILSVGPGYCDLEFHFTGLGFGSSSRMRFKYRLSGLDQTWKEAGYSRKAAYRQAPPGNYKFQVMACNSDGVWNETPVEMTVIVKPRFYQTAFFRIGLLLATWAGLALGVRHYTRRRMQLRLQRQRELERERARIAQDLHDDLGAGLTHIAWLGAAASNETALDSDRRSLLFQIMAKSQDMVRAIDEIVWAVNPKNDSLDHLVTYACQFAEGFFKGTATRCRLDVQEPLPMQLLPSDIRHNLFLILKEALHNVAKHARATEVWLRVQVHAGMVWFIIEDNGCGFLADQQWGGDGLDNIRKRTAAIGAVLELKSESGRGTVYIVKFPIKQI